jgi:cell division transport system permease protein
MSEGLIQGFLGSALAAALVYVVYLVIDHAGGTATSNIFSAMHLSAGELIWTNIVVVLVGVLIGSLGSAIAIRRFLDV